MPRGPFNAECLDEIDLGDVGVELVGDVDEEKDENRGTLGADGIENAGLEKEEDHDRDVLGEDAVDDVADNAIAASKDALTCPSAPLDSIKQGGRFGNALTIP